MWIVILIVLGIIAVVLLILAAFVAFVQIFVAAMVLLFLFCFNCSYLFWSFFFPEDSWQFMVLTPLTAILMMGILLFVGCLFDAKGKLGFRLTKAQLRIFSASLVLLVLLIVVIVLLNQILEPPYAIAGISLLIALEVYVISICIKREKAKAKAAAILKLQQEINFASLVLSDRIQAYANEYGSAEAGERFVKDIPAEIRFQEELAADPNAEIIRDDAQLGITGGLLWVATLGLVTRGKPLNRDAHRKYLDKKAQHNRGKTEEQMKAEASIIALTKDIEFRKIILSTMESQP